MIRDITVIMAGLPGKMASLVAETIEGLNKDDLYLNGIGLTGENQPEKVDICDRKISIYPPKEHETTLETLSAVGGEGDIIQIIADFTQPDAVNRNAELYCKYKIPFVMGTTGGDRNALELLVKNSENTAVIATNMAKPIVLLQSMFEDAAKNFPDALKEFDLRVVESHQATKKDTSGTAKAMVDYFNVLGIPFTQEQIIMIRDKEKQREMGIPEEYLLGHGWHTYSINSRDGTVSLNLKHNVNGRQVYADGTIDAIEFLARKVFDGKRGKVYSMIDVLKGR